MTPTLNPGPRLKRCIESVRSQSYPAVEHIVVDGASSDGTVELLEAASGVRWISEPDDGQSAAINKGFRLAAGQFLGWLNADDVLAPRAVQVSVDAFLENPPAGWSLGWVEIAEASGSWTRIPGPIHRPDWWTAGNVAAQPGSLIARWALEQVGPLDESLHLTMDLDIWLRLIDGGIPCVIVRDTLATFEIHRDSKSGAIPHSRFIDEEARVRSKNGRARSAAFALGRATAWAAYESGRRLSPTGSVASRELSNLGLSPDLSRRLFLAGARVEQGLIDLKAGRAPGIVRLLHPSDWILPETRGRVIGIARRALMRSRFASRLVWRRGI